MQSSVSLCVHYLLHFRAELGAVVSVVPAADTESRVIMADLLLAAQVISMVCLGLVTWLIGVFPLISVRRGEKHNCDQELFSRRKFEIE